MYCEICGIEVLATLNGICEHCRNEALVAVENANVTYLAADAYAQPATLAPGPNQWGMSAIIDGMVIPKKKTHKRAYAEKIVTDPVVIVQELPHKVYQSNHTSARKFIEWLRDVNDSRFSVIRNGQTMFFKTNRDVSNFILGFNVAIEMTGAYYA